MAEPIELTETNDQYVGTADPDEVHGLGGNDTLEGQDGADTLVGGAGDDLLLGGPGKDWLVGGVGNDTLDGGAGSNTIHYDGSFLDYGLRLLDNGTDVVVTDLRVGSPDGADLVRGFTSLVFSDTNRSFASILNNHAPVALSDSITVAEDARSANLWASLVDNDSNSDAGDYAMVSAVTAGLGRLEFDPVAHSLVYVADAGQFDALGAGETLTDVFTYTVRDAMGVSAAAFVRVTVTGVSNGDDDVPFTPPGPDMGPTTPDHLAGSAGGDSLNGAGGADTVEGLAGSDTLLGGAGDDLLLGGDDGDVILGGAGADTIDGGSGGDALDGGDGIDVVKLDFSGRTIGLNLAVADFVQINTTLGHKELRSFEAFDLVGTSSGDTITGGAGGDYLRGEGGDDTLWGGGGNDTLDGGAGSNTIHYEGSFLDYGLRLLDNGTDVIVTDLRAGSPDGVDLVRGFTRLAFADTSRTFQSIVHNHAPIAVNDAITVAEDAQSADLWASLVDNDTSTDFGDYAQVSAVTAGLGSLIFDPVHHSLFYVADAVAFDALAPGETQVDTFTYTVRDAQGLTATASVQVTVTGVQNADDPVAVGGSSPVVGGPGHDFLLGTSGADTIDGAGGPDRIEGGAGGDVLKGGAGVNQLLGQEGNDVLGGDAIGQVTLFDGGQGIDTLVVTSGGDPSIADLAAGTVTGGYYAGSTIQGVENLTAGTATGAVTFRGDGASNQLTGGRFADSLSGAGGADTLAGGAGADTLSGGAGGDRLAGGLGNDVFHFRPGEVAGDQITDFAGNGALVGDSLVFEGFGAGAHLASLGGGRWEVDYSDAAGAHAEVFTLNTASLHASDFMFI